MLLKLKICAKYGGQVSFPVPFNSGRKIVRMQSFYSIDDLTAAGLKPGEPISAIGFKLAVKGSSFGKGAPVLNKVWYGMVDRVPPCSTRYGMVW